MDVHDLLAQYAVDPATLDAAPANPTRAQTMARYARHLELPCTACGREGDSRTSQVAVFPAAGPRWVDLCREHTIETMRPWRGPSTVTGILADVREVAAEAGVRLRVYTDEDGWRDESRP